MEQRAAIKFCFKLNKSATQTYHMMITAYGDACLSRSKVFEWYSRFKSGRESLEDDSREGRPSTSNNDENVELVRVALSHNRRLSVKMLSEQLQISQGSIHTILCEVLGKKKLCAKFVPHTLTVAQKERRVEASRNFIEWADRYQPPTVLARSISCRLFSIF